MLIYLFFIVGHLDLFYILFAFILLILLHLLATAWEIHFFRWGYCIVTRIHWFYLFFVWIRVQGNLFYFGEWVRGSFYYQGALGMIFGLKSWNLGGFATFDYSLILVVYLFISIPRFVKKNP